MLGQKEIEFYHQNGYLSINNVIPDDILTELRQVTDEFVEKSRRVTEHNDVFDLEPGHTPDSPRVRWIKHPADHHPVYDKVLRYDPILNIVTQLIGLDIRHNGHKLNMKYPKFGSPVQWHQDGAFYPHTNDDLLAVGVAIDDMTTENSCLMVIPRSHLGPTYNHHQNGEFIGSVTETDFDPQATSIPVEVKAGGISINHVRMLHGSAPNTSDQPRRLYLIQYCALDAWPLLGIPNWDIFNDCILRGTPNNEPRTTEAPVRIPLPQAERAGSIYEVQSLMEKPLYQ